MDSKRISVRDFEFRFLSYGLYRVTYTTPIRGLKYSNVISDMTIIDKTKNSDEPTQKDLIHLRQLCKRKY